MHIHKGYEPCPHTRATSHAHTQGLRATDYRVRPAQVRGEGSLPRTVVATAALCHAPSAAAREAAADAFCCSRALKTGGGGGTIKGGGGGMVRAGKRYVKFAQPHGLSSWPCAYKHMGCRGGSGCHIRKCHACACCPPHPPFSPTPDPPAQLLLFLLQRVDVHRLLLHALSEAAALLVQLVALSGCRGQEAGGLLLSLLAWCQRLPLNHSVGDFGGVKGVCVCEGGGAQGVCVCEGGGAQGVCVCEGGGAQGVCVCVGGGAQGVWLQENASISSFHCANNNILKLDNTISK